MKIISISLLALLETFTSAQGATQGDLLNFEPVEPLNPLELVVDAEGKGIDFAIDWISDNNYGARLEGLGQLAVGWKAPAFLSTLGEIYMYTLRPEVQAVLNMMLRFSIHLGYQEFYFVVSLEAFRMVPLRLVLMLDPQNPRRHCQEL